MLVRGSDSGARQLDTKKWMRSNRMINGDGKRDLVIAALHMSVPGGHANLSSLHAVSTSCAQKILVSSRESTS